MRKNGIFLRKSRNLYFCICVIDYAFLHIHYINTPYLGDNFRRMKTNTQTITYALADDHTLFRAGIIGVLNDTGHLKNEIEAEDGLELINKLSAAEKLPDICLLDVSMPVMNGYETMAEIKNRWPKLKVLVVSMYTHEHTIIKMLRTGAKGYIAKDASPDELVTAINNVLHTGYYNPEHFVKSVSENEGFTDLTKNELTYLRYCATEMSHAEIAEVLSVSARTVDGYKQTLSDKLNIKTRVGLALFGIQTGLIYV